MNLLELQETYCDNNFLQKRDNIMPPQDSPDVKAQMLIRKPVAKVFEAFVDPAMTTQFSFTKSSGRVEAGKQIRWEWGMYGDSHRSPWKPLKKTSESSLPGMIRLALWSGCLFPELTTQVLSEFPTGDLVEIRMKE